jgi:hypothetical protein
MASETPGIHHFLPKLASAGNAETDKLEMDGSASILNPKKRGFL